PSAVSHQLSAVALGCGARQKPGEPANQPPADGLKLMAESYISDAILREVALTREEYDTIVARLGRPPNAVELGMFGAMWSEHCGYKNSKPLLGRFPTTGPGVLQGPGENAGAVDI